MLENDKYPTQLPLYFYFLKFIKQSSNNNFSGFVETLRNILYAFQITGGGFLYLIFRRVNKPFVGYFAAIIYMFNVWSLNSFMLLKQDMIAIALLISSLYFFKSKNQSWISYILFGLSLGIKHIGIFMLPLYFTPLIFKEASIKNFSFNMSLLLATIFIPAVHFIINNSQSFVNSMLFSITRSPHTSDIYYGYTDLLIKYRLSNNSSTLFQQILPRLPLLITSVFSLLLLFLKKIPLFSYPLISIMVFAIFNPVIFPQYITWIPPFALLSLLDYLDDVKISNAVSMKRGRK